MRSLTLTRTAFFTLLLAVAPGTVVAQKAPVDPGRVTAARELLELSGSAKAFETVLPGLVQQMTRILTSQKPEHRATIEQIMQAMQTKFLSRKQELIDQIAVLYADRLTAQDIADLVTFYKTPAGKKFIEIQPELLKESMAVGQAWGLKLGAEIESGVREELKKRGIDL